MQSRYTGHKRKDIEPETEPPKDTEVTTTLVMHPGSGLSRLLECTVNGSTELAQQSTMRVSVRHVVDAIPFEPFREHVIESYSELGQVSPLLSLILDYANGPRTTSIEFAVAEAFGHTCMFTGSIADGVAAPDIDAKLWACLYAVCFHGVYGARWYTPDTGDDLVHWTDHTVHWIDFTDTRRPTPEEVEEVVQRIRQKAIDPTMRQGPVLVCGPEKRWAKVHQFKGCTHLGQLLDSHRTLGTMADNDRSLSLLCRAYECWEDDRPMLWIPMHRNDYRTVDATSVLARMLDRSGLGADYLVAEFAKFVLSYDVDTECYSLKTDHPFIARLTHDIARGYAEQPYPLLEIRYNPVSGVRWVDVADCK
jgi:hypothetical protein